MTDEEVICEFMEPHESMNWIWWKINRDMTVIHRELTLDALWEVEERLKQDYTKWEQYVDLMMGRKLYHFRKILDYADITATIHATAAQKIKALATVLRNEDNSNAKT